MMSLSATSFSIFYGTSLSVGTTTASSVQNNINKNNNLTTAVPDALPFCGIYVGSEKVNKATTTGNIIRESEGNTSIEVTNANLNTNPYVRISIDGSDNVVAENNSVGSFTLLRSTDFNHNFRGITSAGIGDVSIKK